MRYQEPSPSVDHYSHPQMNTYLYIIIPLTLALSGAGQPRPKRPAGADKMSPLGGTRIRTLSINHGRDQGEGGSNNKNLELPPPRVTGSQNGRGGGHVWSGSYHYSL